MIQSRARGDTVQTSVRMPALLRQQIKAEADRLGRSINTHIVMTMQRATHNGESQDEDAA